VTEKQARYVSIGFMANSAFFAVYHTLIDQDMVFALMSISGFYVFQFGLENPKLLMSSSWKEFGEHADVATGKNKLTGTPLYFAAVFFSVLWIILV